MAQKKIKPYKINLSELIIQSANLDEKEVKSLLQELVTKKQTITITVDWENNNQKSMLLNLSAITHDDIGREYQDNFPFEVYGIMLSIFNVKDIVQLEYLKHDVIHFIGQDIRNHMQPLMNIASLLDMGDLTRDEREYISAMLTEQVNLFLFQQNKLHDLLTQDLLGHNSHIYPSNIDRFIQEAIKLLHHSIESKELRVNLKSSSVIALCYVKPLYIVEALCTFLRLLIDDAITKSTLEIKVIENWKMVTIFITNEGFGMDNKQFQKMLKEKKVQTPDIYLDIQKQIKELESWSGSVVGFSGHSDGIQFEISFLKYGS